MLTNSQSEDNGVKLREMILLKLALAVVLLAGLSGACAKDSSEVEPLEQIATPELPTTPTVSVPFTRLRVVSHNVLWGAGVDRSFDANLHPHQVPHYAGRNRLPIFLEDMKRAEPDIIAIQEVAGWGGVPSVAETVAAELGMFHHIIDEGPNPLKVAIFSRFRIISATSLTPILGPNGALRVTVMLDDGSPLNVVVVHLTTQSEEARNCQVLRLLTLTQTMLIERTILLGDFNFVPGSPNWRSLEMEGWRPVAVGDPYFDQIWLSPTEDWEAQRRVIQAQSGVSDHKPVGVEITYLGLPPASQHGGGRADRSKVIALPEGGCAFGSANP
jgi:endonuclease/exonuclease/phosphatase family metal-dependent hydrolase